jgi:elongation factor Ts
MNITAAMVKELRELTGAGMMECKQALVDANGDKDKAVALLRERGAAKAEKRVGRSAKEGRVEVYVHHDSKGAGVVELNCETDFVARTDDFKVLAADLAMHVYAAAPRFVKREDVGPDIIGRERELFHAQGQADGKKDKALDGFVEGQVRNFYEDNCLLEQVFVKDLARPKKERRTIDQLVKEVSAKTGENVVVSRFARLRVGEG